jgi:ketosteroid isomerase-like protein
MSQENVEIVRAAFAAINLRDWDAALSDAAPDWEYDLSRAVGPFRGVYKLGQARRLFEEFTDPWESLRWEAEEFIEAGEYVVTPFTNYLRGRDGIEVQARAAFLWTIRDRSIARICFYQERQQALEAAGLQE